MFFGWVEWGPVGGWKAGWGGGRRFVLFFCHHKVWKFCLWGCCLFRLFGGSWVGLVVFGFSALGGLVFGEKNVSEKNMYVFLSLKVVYFWDEENRIFFFFGRTTVLEAVVCSEKGETRPGLDLIQSYSITVDFSWTWFNHSGVSWVVYVGLYSAS